MEYNEIVSKSVELSKSFINTSIGMLAGDFENVRKIGDLARFAVTLRNTISLSERQLNVLSVAMKINTSTKKI
jgi:hypothetical protein